MTDTDDTFKNTHALELPSNRAANFFGSRLLANVRSILAIGGVVMLAGSAAYAEGLTLSWSDNSDNEDGFKIERSTDGSSFNELISVGEDVVDYVDESVQDGVEYWYRVLAFNEYGESGYTNIASSIYTAPNEAPTISAISDEIIELGSGNNVFAFTVGDLESDDGDLTLSAVSSTASVIGNGSISFGGTGSNRTLKIDPEGSLGTTTLTITVSDGVNETQETLLVTVIEPLVAPIILTQPEASIHVVEGFAASFSVSASGNPAASFQWRKDGENIEGATEAEFEIASAVISDAGVYTVVISNSKGSVVSDAVELTVSSLESMLPRVPGDLIISFYIGEPLSGHEIAMTNDPSDVRAVGLPPGFFLDSESRVLSGTAEVAGVYSVALFASNGYGQDTESAFIIEILEATPLSGMYLGSFEDEAGRDFVFQILSDGKGIFLGYDPVTDSLVYQDEVEIDENGFFEFTLDNPEQAGNAPKSVVTVSGRVQNGVLSGDIFGQNQLSFAGSKPAGEEVEIEDLYQESLAFGISSPADGSEVENGKALRMSVELADPEDIETVIYYQEGVVMAEVSVAPFSADAIFFVPGQIELRAVAVKKDGSVMATQASWITVGASVEEPVLPQEQVFYSREIGKVGKLGAADYDASSDAFVIEASGAGIGASEDHFRFTYLKMSGDMTIVAKLRSLKATRNLTQAGLLIRSSLDPRSESSAVLVNGDGDVSHVNREIFGSGSQQVSTGEKMFPSLYIRLAKEGAIVRSYVSKDGSIWDLVSESVLVTSEDFYVGMALSSHSGNRLARAVFEDVAIEGGAIVEGGAYTDNPKGSPMPDTSEGSFDDLTVANVDIGKIGKAGNYEYFELDGASALSVASGDIWGKEDGLHFAYVALKGDFEYVARVKAMKKSSNWTKAGVMVRSSLEANAAQASGMLLVQSRLGFFRRENVGDFTSYDGSTSQLEGSVFVKLTRIGNSVTVRYSEDGLAWTMLGSERIALGETAYVGLALASKNMRKNAYASFDSVSITQP